jgi:hypothetical protein
VRTAREWTLTAPPNASDKQKGEIVIQQLNALFEEIKGTSGNQWSMDRYYVPPHSASASSSDAVAIFDWSDMEHPTLAFYTKSFAPLRNSWEKVAESYERQLAHVPGCVVKASAVSIN